MDIYYIIAMDQIDINQIAVGTFLLITLLVGLRSKRANSIEEYASMGRSLSSGVLMISIIATLICSRDLNYIDVSFKNGMVTLLSALATPIMAFFVGYFVYPKLISFKEDYTLSDIMHKLYGSLSGYFASIISITISILFIATQLKFMGGLSSMMVRIPAGMTMGIPNSHMIIYVFGGLITLYTCVGGIRSVAYTDVLQFGCIALGLVTLLMLHYIGREPIDSSISIPNHYTILDSPRFTNFTIISFFWGIVPATLIIPPIIQRVLFFRRKETVRNTFVGVSIISIIFIVIMICLGLSLAARYLNINRLHRKDIGVIINMLCKYPVGRSLFFLVPIAIVMSTIDSFLNSAAVDMVRSLQKARILNENSFGNNNRIATLLIGAISIALAILLYDLRDSNEIMGYAVILMSTIVVPFLMGTIGFKGHKAVFWITLASFFMVLYLFTFHLSAPKVLIIGVRKSKFFSTLRSAWFLAIPISTVVFFLSHYICFNGFKWEQREDKLTATTYNWQSIDRSWFTDPIKCANDKAQDYGTEPYWVSIFLYISFLIPYVSKTPSMESSLVVAIIRCCGIIPVTSLLLRSVWSKKHLKYFNLLYYFTILLCVPFLAIMTIWQDPQSGSASFILLLSLMVLIVLVDWQTFCLFNIISLIIAMAVQKYWHGYIIPDFGSDLPFVIITSISSLQVCIFIAGIKQRKFKQVRYNLTKKNEETTNHLQIQQEAHHQLASSLDPRSSMISEMQKSIAVLESQKADQQQLDKLKNAIAHLVEIKEKSLNHLPLNPQKGSITHLIEGAIKDLNAMGITEQINVHLDKSTTKNTVVADLAYLQKLLTNGLKHHFKHEEEAHCFVDSATIAHTVGDKIKEIASFRITISNQKPTPIEKAYDLEQESPILSKTDKYLNINSLIIQAHFGVMELSKQPKQTYVLPYNVNQLRPKIETFVDEDLKDITKLDAKEDIAFLQLVAQKGLRQKPIEKALRICKHYHRKDIRKSGEPYYLHPVKVATILLSHTKNENIIIAGLLHDTIEDTAYTAHQMNVAFGTEVTDIVNDVTNLYSAKNRKIKLQKQEVFTTLLKKENEGPLLVKLIDRLHNIRTITGHPNPAKQQQIASETLEFFVPIAARLGKKEIATELSNICDKILSS